MESKFKVDGSWYATSDLAWRMNEYDEYAVEQAVQLKEQVDGSDLTVLCIGPDRVKETMKKALAMGCDRGFHIADDSPQDKDPRAIASLIADYAKEQSFDYIFTGMQSQDRGSAQVGIMVAELLDIPAVSTIVDFSFEAKAVTVRRELEGGTRAVVKIQGPALFTCQLGLNSPRYPTLPNIMKAKKKELIIVNISDLQKLENLQETMQMSYPEKKGGGLVLEGDPADLAKQLISILKEQTSVLA